MSEYDEYLEIVQKLFRSQNSVNRFKIVFKNFLMGV